MKSETFKKIYWDECKRLAPKVGSYRDYDGNPEQVCSMIRNEAIESAAKLFYQFIAIDLAGKPKIGI